MPYVQRDESNKVKGIYAVLQPGIAEEWLPPDSPDVLAFLNPIIDTNLLDQETLNQALIAPGSYTRALGLVMFDEVNKLRVKGGDAAYTLNQFKAALKAKMR